MSKKQRNQTMTIDVELSQKQIIQLAKDAALCAGATILYTEPGTIGRAAAKRILKVLKLES